jgi:hypothetical protein
MRVLGLLLVTGALLCAACTSTTSPDEDCITQGGTCFISEGYCGIQIQAGCSSGYSCCATTSINAYNVRDGALFDAGPVPVVREGGTDGAPDASHDGSHDGAHEATSKDTGTPDSGTIESGHPDSGDSGGDGSKSAMDSGATDSAKSMDSSDGSKTTPMDSGAADAGKTADGAPG